MSLKNHLVHTMAAAFAASLALSAFAESADARPGRRGAAVGEAGGAGAGARARGSRSRDVTLTGQNGRQRTIETDRTRNRAEGTFTRDRTTTFNDGSRRVVDVDGQRTSPGNYDVTREVTGRNGQTRTQTGSFEAQRTADGRSVTGDINTQNYGQIDYQRNVTHGDGARSVNSSATFEDGTSITRASNGSCGSGVCTSTGVITGRDGGQTTWDQTRTRTENGATRERDVTFADGTTRSVDAERVGNGDGTGTITRTVTQRDGDIVTRTGEYEIDRNP
jgi:hypothetical protein